jgi:prepilin peptidase CpaA
MPVYAQGVFLSAVILFTAAAAVADVRTRRLPNWLTVPAFAAALVFHAVTGGLSGLGGALGGFAIGFGVLFVLWLIGGGGGGDVKLMGALGAWLGPIPTLLVVFLSSVFAVLGAVGMMGVDLVTQGFSPLRRKYFAKEITAGKQRRPPATAEEQRRLRNKRRVLPYAAPVALATWLVLAWRVLQ